MLRVLNKPIEGIEICIECLVERGMFGARNVLIVGLLEVFGHYSDETSMEVKADYKTLARVPKIGRREITDLWDIIASPFSLAKMCVRLLAAYSLGPTSFTALFEAR
jgi:hypothetical protein